MERRPWIRSLSKLGGCVLPRRANKKSKAREAPIVVEKEASRAPSASLSPSSSVSTFVSVHEVSPCSSSSSFDAAPVHALSFSESLGSSTSFEESTLQVPSLARSKTTFEAPTRSSTLLVETEMPSLLASNQEGAMITPTSLRGSGRPPMVRRIVSAPTGSQRVNFQMHPTIIPTRARLATEDTSASFHRRQDGEAFDEGSLRAIHLDEASAITSSSSSEPPCREIDFGLATPNLSYSWSNATGFSYQNGFDEDDNDSLQWSDDEEKEEKFPMLIPPPSSSPPVATASSPDWMQNWVMAQSGTDEVVENAELQKNDSFVELNEEQEEVDDEEIAPTYFCNKCPQAFQQISKEAEILSGWAVASWEDDLTDEDKTVDYSKHMWYVQVTNSATLMLVRAGEQRTFAFGSDYQMWSQPVSSSVGNCLVIQDANRRLQILPVPSKAGKLCKLPQDDMYAPDEQHAAVMHARFCVDANWRHYHSQFPPLSHTLH